jgi:FlaA1/EpsC-like NDP-sugar epimerase
MVVCEAGKYCTMNDFGGAGVIPLLSAIVTAIPPFFSIMLFTIWIFGTGGSYFAILKFTGKKRFWHTLTAFSFVTFLMSLLIVGMNTSEITFLDGYWIGFYILMTLVSWIMLDRYK